MHLYFADRLHHMMIISVSAAGTLVHSFILTCLDYCNSVRADLP